MLEKINFYGVIKHFIKIKKVINNVINKEVKYSLYSELENKSLYLFLIK